jgi:hypothetical protein
MDNCQFCGSGLHDHHSDCRVRGDMDMFQRVYERLRREERNGELQTCLARYLTLYGRMAGA